MMRRHLTTSVPLAVALAALGATARADGPAPRAAVLLQAHPTVPRPAPLGEAMLAAAFAHVPHLAAPMAPTRGPAPGGGGVTNQAPIEVSPRRPVFGPVVLESWADSVDTGNDVAYVRPLAMAHGVAMVINPAGFSAGAYLLDCSVAPDDADFRSWQFEVTLDGDGATVPGTAVTANGGHLLVALGTSVPRFIGLNATIANGANQVGRFAFFGCAFHAASGATGQAAARTAPVVAQRQPGAGHPSSFPAMRRAVVASALHVPLPTPVPQPAPPAPPSQVLPPPVLTPTNPASNASSFAFYDADLFAESPTSVVAELTRPDSAFAVRFGNLAPNATYAVDCAVVGSVRDFDVTPFGGVVDGATRVLHLASPAAPEHLRVTVQTSAASSGLGVVFSAPTAGSSWSVQSCTAQRFGG